MWTNCGRNFLLLCDIRQGNYYANKKNEKFKFIFDFYFFFHEQRDNVSQTAYCDSNAMKLLFIECYAEEQAIQAAWGTSECNYKLMLYNRL